MPTCSPSGARARRARPRRRHRLRRGQCRGDAFADRSYDAVAIAFGIRNVPRIEAALAEAHRVLRIGGRFLCLEFSTVDVPGLDALLRVLFLQCDPALGRAVAATPRRTDISSNRYAVFRARTSSPT